jgi:ABC-type cobalamin/Fe3+-siderophores transport system ATPase subunit
MTMNQGYQGMRWYKCDLHLHTPEDARHWQDSRTHLKDPRNETDLQEKARLYLRQCYHLGLECIAITDHNFSTQSDHRKWFLTHLIEQNSTVARELDKAALIIFPGFELDLRYHVLCLFEPVKKSKDLQKLSDILTQMELPVDKRMINSKPQQPRFQGRSLSLREVLNKVQNESESGGIVIAAHAFSNDGICNDSANIPDFINNPDLYAVEVSEWPLAGKPKDILEGHNREWRRNAPGHQPAPIRSSDAKRLNNSTDSAKNANVPGYRFSWIKMSQPSIESLRQAFLDHSSRICLEPEPMPADHTHITSISVKGTKFLEDQTVHFSPHLNCIIGGRGSGKSMLFESLRLALRGEVHLDLSEKSSLAAKAQIQRLWQTFKSQTCIEAAVSHGGLQDLFVVNAPGQPAQIQNRHVDDPPTVFRNLNTLIYSQEEITELTSRQKTLIEFIDDLVRDQLEKPRQEAISIIDRLKKAHQEEEILERIERELNSLKQEVEELSRQLEAREKVQEELKKHRTAQEAQRYIELLRRKSLEIEERIMNLAEEWEAGPPAPGSRLDDFQLKDFLTQAEEKISHAYRELVESLRSSVHGFREKIHQALDKHPDLAKVQAAITQAEKGFETACREKGLTPQEAGHLKEIELQYRAKKAAWQAKKAERDNLGKQKPDIKELFDKLTLCWRQETRVRQKFLAEILESDAMPRIKPGKDNQSGPVIQAEVTFSGNREAFLEDWGKLAPDRRRNEGRMWDKYDSNLGEHNIGDQLFNAFSNYVEKQNSLGKSDKNPGVVSEYRAGNPVQWLELHLEKPDDLPPRVQEYLENIKTVRKEKYDMWFKLLVKRIPDSADLELFRFDGTSAGSFARDDLSTGQKNTAILSLLLAAGKGPVLIDQPEDQLDSEFLFQELVPMIREAREKRQLIIITHNANIPVNADAELVYALEAREGHGKCRTQGGLDRRETAKAVLDIMEGSEEAFRRRKEKYHF